MKRLATTTGGTWGYLVLGLLFSAAIPMAAAWAQTPTGQAFGMSVSTPTTSSTSALAVLPTDGSLGSADASSVSVTGFAAADNVFAFASGSEGSAESNTTLENVNLLGGLITAEGVTALASSAASGGAAFSDAEGSQLVNVVVNGVSMGSDFAPNTRVDLPGVGYAVLNEQIPSGNGVTSSGLTVNMIHVVLLNAKASEQSARMVSMKAATDSAVQMIKDLTLEYNKLRQGRITQELLEIAGGQAQ